MRKPLFIAFFEIIIWLLAMEVVMSDLTNIANFFAFAFGFAMGTYVGLVIDEKLSIGRAILRIVTTEESNGEIASFLRSENLGVIRLDAKGARGNVNLILIIAIDVSRIKEHLPMTNPQAFSRSKMSGMQMKERLAVKNPMQLLVFFNSFIRPGKKKYSISNFLSHLIFSG